MYRDNDVSFLFESSVRPLKTGISYRDDGSCCTVYAVYDKAQAEQEVGWIADTGNTEFAERLTGLYYHNSRSPGSSFAGEPDVRVYGKKLIITQIRGRDI